MVSDFTYPLLAKPHTNPFPTEMQHELCKTLLKHTGKNNAENLHLDYSEDISTIMMLGSGDNDNGGFSAQISSNPKLPLKTFSASLPAATGCVSRSGLEQNRALVTRHT